MGFGSIDFGSDTSWVDDFIASNPDNTITPEPVQTTPEEPEPAVPVEDTDGYGLIKDALERYGLESLLPQVLEYVKKDFSVPEMIARLKGTPEFEERFPALAERRKNGLNAISIDEYLTLEDGYRQTMKAYGIPEEFYDNNDLAEFIANDVSVNEVTERVSMASEAVAGVDPNLKGELARLYGVGGDTDGDIIAYFLDPDRAVTAFEARTQLSAATISSAAVAATGGGLTSNVAEQLANQNVQKREVTERLTSQAGLTQATLGTQGVSTSELAASSFGLDPDSVAEVRRLRQRRRETKQSGMGGLVQQQGATGLGAV